MRNGQIPATESQKAQKLVPSEDRMWSRAQSRRVIPQSGSSPPFHHRTIPTLPEQHPGENFILQGDWTQEALLGDMDTSMGGDEAIYRKMGIGWQFASQIGELLALFFLLALGMPVPGQMVISGGFHWKLPWWDGPVSKLCTCTALVVILNASLMNMSQRPKITRFSRKASSIKNISQNKQKTTWRKLYTVSKRNVKTTAATTIDILREIREGFMPTEQEQGAFLKHWDVIHKP